MPKRLLTLDDLYRFYCDRGRSQHFSAKNEGDQIVVQVPGMVGFEKASDNMEGLCPVHLQACHTQKNANNSFISDETMKRALPSFSNRPILGYIYKDENGDYQFRDHAMHMEDDELIYDEKIIGTVPESCNAHLKYDEEKNKNYVEVDGYIFEEYSQAKEILERETECSVSVELSIKELSYDSKEKMLNIEDFYFSGVTILGKWEDGTDVQPGMTGSNIRITEFKKRNNSSFSQEQLIVMLNEMNEKIDQLTINQNLTKGGKTEAMNLFEQLLEQYGVTAEDVTFEYEGLSDEELTAKFEEAFVAKKKKDEDDGPATSEEETPSVEEPEAETEPEPVLELEPETEQEPETETEPEADADGEADDSENYQLTYSVHYGDIKKEFSVSLKDKINALYSLVNSTYADQDGCWYDVEVFEDPKYVIMYDMWSGINQGYKQTYKVTKDVYSLVGDRTPVKQMWVTEDEEKQLDQMKAKYADAQSKLASYEAEPEKMSVLSEECYSSIADSEEFVELMKQESHFNMSVEEVRAKADELLLNAAKSGALQFATEKKTVNAKRIPVSDKPKRSGRYGGIFSNK